MELLLCLVLAVTLSAGQSAILNEEGKQSDLQMYLDCYWRQYNQGEIPPDAIIGGHDIHNRHTYIGQALVYAEAFNQTIYAEVPFNLNPHTKRHVLGVGGPVVIKSHIKILCCAYDDSVEWIKTTSQSLFLDLTNRKPVLGGQQLHLEAPIKHDLLIGRTPAGKEQIVGKVLINGVQDIVFYYVNSNSTAMLNANPYEVLVYRA
nr:unnamed protein product [Callosobruchus chinensis]